MNAFFRLLRSIGQYKLYTFLGVVFHMLTAILTVISIPLVIPFFQILFGVSPSDYSPPTSAWDLEANLNYYFSRLIAISDHFIALQFICIAVVVIYFLKNVCRFLVSYFMVYVRNGLLRDLRSKIWYSFTTLPIKERYKHPQGYLMSLITNDLSEVDHGIFKVFELLFKTPLILLGSLVFMIWLDLRLTLIAFGLILFTLVIIGGVSHILKRQSAMAQSTLSTITVIVDQYLKATKLIRTHHAGGYFQQRFDVQNERYFSLSNKMLRRRDLASPLAEFLGVITVVVLLYFGTHTVFNGDLEPATFFAFIFAFYNIIDPAKSFSREYANVQKGLAALDRINEFTDLERSIDNDAATVINAEFTDQIAFRDVHFSYEGNPPVFNGLNFTIKRGERIGIVGISGVGKTTLIDLLLRFYQLNSGQIFLDDKDINSLNLVSYRNLFGLVTQQPHLFHGTAKDNILLDMEVNEQQLGHILKMVGLSEEFMEKRIGDGSTMISGGEAQRICLARVLYRKPEILLLDEPTSQLDRTSVDDLIATIMEITAQQTVIMISHHPRLLSGMDRIIVLEEGQIVDDGQYDELYQRNHFFKRMVGT